MTEEGDAAHAVKIRVRAETSKVRQSRTFIVRDNQYFQNLREFHKKATNKADNEISRNYVFSLDGKTPITERAILYHFGKIIELAEIDITERDIVPYSFRHYFITQKLVHGLNHRQVADICGTSITQIEKTYYHVDEEMMSDTAMLDHDKGNDGIIVRELED
jgi:site-specific recombinase XerD